MISESFAAASIVILPALVVIKTAASPIVKSSYAWDMPSWKYVLNVAAVVNLIVPPSFVIIPSASATAVVPAEVPPSIKLISVAVASRAANFVKSAWTSPETLSNRFNSAAVEVTAVEPRTNWPSGITALAAPLNIKSSTEVSQVTFALAVSP